MDDYLVWDFCESLVPAIRSKIHRSFNPACPDQCFDSKCGRKDTYCRMYLSGNVGRFDDMGIS